MSFAKWIGALVLGALPVFAHAQLLDVFTETNGHVTATDGYFWELLGNGSIETGMPVSIQFNVGHWPPDATVEAGTLTMPTWGFRSFGVSVGDAHVDIDPAPWGEPGEQNWIRLQDNVRNASGDLVDVFELTVPAMSWVYYRTHYLLTTHLEFAADTFDNLEPRSILDLEDATLLGGTLHLKRFEDRIDIPRKPANIYADVDGFAVRFAGPYTEISPVPEPSHAAMLLSGLAGVLLLRCRSMWQLFRRQATLPAGHTGWLVFPSKH